MQMTFTERAIAKIQDLCAPDARLKLVYDTEGCGCAVNGVPALWRIDRAEDGDIRVSSNAFEVYIEPRHAVFFEDELTLDGNPAPNSFRLMSEQQIYSSTMPITDKRSETAPRR